MNLDDNNLPYILRMIDIEEWKKNGEVVFSPELDKPDEEKDEWERAFQPPCLDVQEADFLELTEDTIIKSWSMDRFFEKLYDTNEYHFLNRHKDRKIRAVMTYTIVACKNNTLDELFSKVDPTKLPHMVAGTFLWHSQCGGGQIKNKIDKTIYQSLLDRTLEHAKTILSGKELEDFITTIDWTKRKSYAPNNRT